MKRFDSNKNQGFGKKKIIQRGIPGWKMTTNTSIKTKLKYRNQSFDNLGAFRFIRKN